MQCQYIFHALDWFEKSAVPSSAITGAIRETFRENFYQELGLESLQNRRCARGLCSFQKVFSTKLPPYLYELKPPITMVTS